MLSVPRQRDDNDQRKPRWWLQERDGKKIVMMLCSHGHIGSLEDHDISEDGIVNPSVLCPEENCDFHEMVVLENYRTS